MWYYQAFSSTLIIYKHGSWEAEGIHTLFMGVRGSQWEEENGHDEDDDVDDSNKDSYGNEDDDGQGLTFPGAQGHMPLDFAVGP